MAQDNHRQGSEDNRENLEHMRNVQENTDALADQARRVEASAPEGTDRPVEGLHVPGMGGEDTRQARENLRNVEQNRDALEAQSRRVDATTPDDINRTGPQDG
ncbi:MAG TPA: hypothetical protein VLK84_17240 [Longimicrobium sp.]|nr:hypothetical protein [Longimicrobium sp.]